ncbi:MAG: hypothetical protein ACKPEA_11220, partial [Planctomycetota bacterium]
MRTLACCVALALLALAPAQSPAPPSLQQAFDAIQAFRDREDPMEAISKGRPADAGRIMDRSLAAIERRLTETKALLATLRAVDKGSLSERDRLDA